MNMNSSLAIGLLACLLASCLLARLLFKFSLFLYSQVSWKSTRLLKTHCRSPKNVAKFNFPWITGNPLVKNVVSNAQNCNESQIAWRAMSKVYGVAPPILWRHALSGGLGAARPILWRHEVRTGFGLGSTCYSMVAWELSTELEGLDVLFYDGVQFPGGWELHVLFSEYMQYLEGWGASILERHKVRKAFRGAQGPILWWHAKCLGGWKAKRLILWWRVAPPILWRHAMSASL